MNEPYKPENIDLDHIARLARLRIAPEHREAMSRDFAAIVAFARDLSGLDPDSIETTAHTAAVHNRFREDTVKPSMSREELLTNAPKAEDGCFVVPRVVD